MSEKKDPPTLDWKGTSLLDNVILFIPGMFFIYVLKPMLLDVEHYLIISSKHYITKLIKHSGDYTPTLVLYIKQLPCMNIGFGASGHIQITSPHIQRRI